MSYHAAGNRGFNTSNTTFTSTSGVGPGAVGGLGLTVFSTSKSSSSSQQQQQPSSLLNEDYDLEEIVHDIVSSINAGRYL